jgi:tRNA(Ile)-lysidine synthase
MVATHHPPILERVEIALGDAGLLSPGGCTIVAAVSGGPDSMALLGLLCALAERYPLKVQAAHLDHGLRGEESEADARYVGESCRRLSVPVVVERTDVAALRTRRRLSWEAAARDARYDFLARVAASVGASAVALGHTADDQAETVLLHLLRGTGMRGLQGMLSLSHRRGRDGAPDATLVRPLLHVTRQETEAYCAEHGIAPRQDSSNRDERFTRNRIRMSLMPRLRRYNPAVREALTRLSYTMARDMAYIDQQVRDVWPRVVAQEPWGLRLDRGVFNSMHPSIQAHLIQHSYAYLAGDGEQMSVAQVEEARRLATEGAGRSLSLGRGLRLITSYEDMVVTGRAPDSPWPLFESQHLPVPGSVCTVGWKVAAREIPVPDAADRLHNGGPFCARLSLDALGKELLLRSRRPGDRFQPLGMDGSKKLKEFLIDAHVPRTWRDGIPLVVGQHGVAWVVGLRIAHWARVTPRTRQVVELSLSREA